MSKAPTEIRSLARSHTEKALNVLVGIMSETKAPPAARVSAANSILERGWGKAVQALAGADGEGPILISRIEIVAPGYGNSED